jgi:hypothetical protein
MPRATNLGSLLKSQLVEDLYLCGAMIAIGHHVQYPACGRNVGGLVLCQEAKTPPRCLSVETLTTRLWNSGTLLKSLSGLIQYFCRLGQLLSLRLMCLNFSLGCGSYSMLTRIALRLDA